MLFVYVVNLEKESGSGEERGQIQWSSWSHQKWTASSLVVLVEVDIREPGTCY